MPSEVPDGWTAMPLAKAGTWLSGGTPRRINKSYWGGEIPWISAKSIHDFYLDDSEDRVTPEGAENGTKLVPPGTVLMVVRGMSLANEFRVGIARRSLTFNQDLKAILPDNDRLNPMYLGLYLQGSENEVLGMVSTASHGTCKLDTGRLGALPVLVPPLPEQRKIAAILSSVDDTIQATQAVIDQTRRVKEGLLQDLLTRGIGHTRFKQTAIGEIPESWQVRAVGALFHTQLGKMMSKAARLGPNQKPYLRNINVRWRHIDLSDLDTIHFDDREMEKFDLRVGDILMCEGRALGRCSIWHGQMEGIYFQKALHRLRSAEGQMLPEFMVNYAYYAFKVVDIFAGDRLESTIPHLTKERLQRLLVPLPPLREQAEIVRRLDALWEQLRQEESQVHNLLRLRNGLLHDLLTGKVRVSA